LFFEIATIEGVVLNPSAFVITVGCPPSIAATNEFVVKFLIMFLVLVFLIILFIFAIEQEEN
jgi:hypothetical protein